jgi:hypothetical protein
MDGNKVRGGFLTIGEDLMNEWLEEKLGVKGLKLHHVTTEHYNGAVAISFTCNDERFPEVKKGQRFPEALLLLEDKNGKIEIKNVEVLG